MTEPTPAIIWPFRWWKTCGIFAAVFFGAMLPGIVVAVLTPDRVPDLQRIIADPFGPLLILAGGVALSMTAALVLCVAQIYALKGYYNTGQVRTYRSRLYTSSILQFLLFGLIAASGGILSPIGITIWTVYYVKNRRQVRAEIRRIEAEQPHQVDQTPKPSTRLRDRLTNLSGWKRAWLVLAVTWGAVLLAWSSLAPPKSPREIRTEINARLGDHEYPIGDPRRVETMRNGQKYTALRDFDVQELAKLEELHKKLRIYPHDLASYIINSAAVWAFPLIMIYLFGVGVAWVRAGFLNKTRHSERIRDSSLRSE